MYFRILHDDVQGWVGYLLADLDAREAVVIDPRADDEALVAALLREHQLTLRDSLFTHRHTPAPKAAPAPHRDGELIAFGAEHLHVLDTPGHTRSCQSFLWRDRLFCGGLLTAMACPHRPQVAAPQAMWDSVVNKVYKLPAETLLFSGHAKGQWIVSTVLTQRHRHPWFAGLNRDDFLDKFSSVHHESHHHRTHRQ